MVVGDLIGSGASQEQALSARRQTLRHACKGIAEPNTVVIAESTRKLVGNLFELEDLGSRDLKGITGPVRAWAALRASSVESRFEAQHETKLTPLVGRTKNWNCCFAGSPMPWPNWGGPAGVMRPPNIPENKTRCGFVLELIKNRENAPRAATKTVIKPAQSSACSCRYA